MQILIYISIGIVIGLIAYGILYGGKGSFIGGDKMNRKEKRGDIKQKILSLLGEKGKVTNNDIEKLLDVSDSTATKYLQRLENEGKIKQVGKTGQSVYYIIKYS